LSEAEGILDIEMPRERRLLGLPLAGMAAAGVVLGHWLTYVFAVPDPHIRAEILTASGHSYWLVAVKAAVVLGCISLGTVFVRHMGGGGESAGSDGFIALAARLSFVQAIAFTAMEVAERVAVGAPLPQMLGHHLFVLGLAVQIVIAFAGAFVLLWFSRTVARLVRILLPDSLPRPATVFICPSYPALRPIAVLAGAGGVRGPPLR